MSDKNTVGLPFPKDIFTKPQSEQPERVCGLSEKVAALERKADSLDALCGHMIATLKVNMGHGYLIGHSMKTNDKFEELVAAWKRQYKEAQNGLPPLPASCRNCLTRELCPNDDSNDGIPCASFESKDEDRPLVAENGKDGSK